MSGHIKTHFFDNDQEDRILEALAFFRQDIIEEIVTLKRIITDTLGKCVLIESQHLDCRDIVSNSESENDVSSLKKPKKRKIAKDMERIPFTAENNIISKPSECHNVCVDNSEERPVVSPTNFLGIFEQQYLPNMKTEIFASLQHTENDTATFVRNGPSVHNKKDSRMQNFEQDYEVISSKSDVFSSCDNVQESPQSALDFYIAGANDYSDESELMNGVNKLHHKSIKLSDEENCASIIEHVSSARQTKIYKIKPVKCPLCGKTFKKKVILKNHMLTHKKEKPFECHVCQKRFFSQKQLTCHYRIHTGEKPYKCEVCERRFSHRSNFSVHKRTHTGEKPYQCKHCKKRFTQLNSLKRHIQFTVCLH